MATIKQLAAAEKAVDQATYLYAELLTRYTNENHNHHGTYMLCEDVLDMVQNNGTKDTRQMLDMLREHAANSAPDTHCDFYGTGLGAGTITQRKA